MARKIARELESDSDEEVQKVVEYGEKDKDRMRERWRDGEMERWRNIEIEMEIEKDI